MHRLGLELQATEVLAIDLSLPAAGQGALAIEAVRGSPGHAATAPLDDEAIVDDFMTHVDRRPEPLERQFNDLDRAVDACAKAARRRDQHSKWRS